MTRYKEDTMKRSDLWGWTVKFFGITIEVVFYRWQLVTLAIDRKNTQTWYVIDR